MPPSYPMVVALVVMLVVTVAVFAFLSEKPTIYCDAYNVRSLGDASHPPVFITPPPGWKDYGGCWGP